MRRERMTRGWSQSDAVHAMRTFSNVPLPEGLLDQWKRWERGRNKPDEFYRPLIAATFGTVVESLFSTPRPPLASGNAFLLSATGMDTHALIQRIRCSGVDNGTLDAIAVKVEQLCCDYARRDASVAESEAEKEVVEAENSLRVKRAELAAKANQAEEKAAVARAIARVEEERRLEQLRVELNRSKYEAEIVVPARADKEADELRAQGQAARILENGKATAEAMARLREQWKSEESRDIMLLQMLPDLLDRVTSVLSENLHIERLTVLDGGEGGLSSHVRGLTGSIVAVMEQLKNATGVDVAGILRAKENGKPEGSFPKELG